MQFAICQELFVDWPWERQCRTIAEIGYTGVELAPFTLGPRPTALAAAERRALRETAEQAGLDIIGLHWLLAKTEGLHLTSPDPQIQQATSDYLRRLADLCADLGGRVLVFGSPAQRNLLPGVTREAADAHARAVFNAAMPTFAERNVFLCMEPLTTRETNYCNSCAEAVQLMRLVNHPQFVLHQDVKAMLGEGRPLPQLIHEFAAETRHFHVNDSNLLGPGMGETDFHPIFAALQASGYAGWVSVEVFDYQPGAEYIARASFDYMRQVLADLG